MQIVSHNNFPVFLTEISSSPLKLYYEGNISLLKKRCITIVGTRDITQYGKWCIDNLLSKFLQELDIVVVSGLARGVDAYVHRTCLKRSIKTMAIVPGAINSAIPKSNMGIFSQIKNEGLILAEYPLGSELGKEMFILRNRLLAGISGTTIVVEAGVRSGSLITAKFALEYNRDIYVIPGNINSNMSQGCNMLAKQGAGIITCVEDFKEILGIENEQVLLKF
jgi:DNA processing protein